MYENCRYNVYSNGYLLVCNKMTGRNDRAISDDFEDMTNVMGHANQELQNHNEMVGEFRRLGKFQRNNPPTFKGRYDPYGAQVRFQEIENIFRVMACSDTHKVLFSTHILAEEAKY